MFERFTTEARHIIVIAEEHAKLYGHSTIGTEHLLAALLEEQDSIPQSVLMQLGITKQNFEEKLNEIKPLFAGRNLLVVFRFLQIPRECLDVLFAMPWLGEATRSILLTCY